MQSSSSNSTTSPHQDTISILEHGRSEKKYWADLWNYRELFLILAWRDIAVRYKQTVIGLAWAILRPFLTMVVFTVIFGNLAKLPTEGSTPYAILVFTGMLPWFLLSNILSEASQSLVINGALVGKVYFPRLIIPTSSAVVAVIDFLINLVILFGMMIWFDFYPGWQIIFLPFFMFLALVASLGPSLFLTALNVKYRDFRFVIPFIVQFGLYISPVGFSSSIVPDQWRLLYSLNPVVGIIDGFRWCLLGGQAELYLPGFLLSIAIVLLFLWYGIYFFRRTEKTFADLI